ELTGGADEPGQQGGAEFFAGVLRVDADGGDVGKRWAVEQAGESDDVSVVRDDLVDAVGAFGHAGLVFGLEEVLGPAVGSEHNRVQCGDLRDVVGTPGALGVASGQQFGQVHLRNCFGMVASWPRKYWGSTGSRPRPRRRARLP